MSFPYRRRRTVKPAMMDPEREVAPDVIREILEDAHWAPTHGLTQPWRFHVFSGTSRLRLADALEAIYDHITDSPRPDKRAKFRANALAAPVVVAVAACLDRTGKISELDEIAATSCAVQNLLLSAHERGLGTFWATPPAACSAEFSAWLGLEGAHQCLGLVFVGHPREGVSPTSTRNALDTRVTFHSDQPLFSMP